MNYYPNKKKTYINDLIQKPVPIKYSNIGHQVKKATLSKFIEDHLN